MHIHLSIYAVKRYNLEKKMMVENNMKKHQNAKLLGFVLIMIGIGLAGQVFGIWSLHIFRGWWTLFIIVPSIISILEKGVHSGNVTALVIGAVLLLSTQDILGWDLIGRMVFPGILVAAGIALLIKYNSRNGYADPSSAYRQSFSALSEEEQSAVHHAVIFSERNIVYPNKEYQGASLSVSFGKITFDLTNAAFAGDRNLFVNAMFGNVLLVVPAGVNVIAGSSPVFGSIKNNTVYSEGAPCIRVDVSCIFATMTILSVTSN